MARWVARSYIPWEPPTASATASSGALQADLSSGALEQ